ncbi:MULTISPECIES: LysR family transcriptional regulator [Streptomyces]|uniref:LysR family transcriptional regulator n=1 Tax=Streptomyces TaxID=1883 RepID=UPI0006C2BD10|nr:MULTISPECIES: LysR family transcriptional regulator [Streptomyces]KOT55013.1 LysR family transcriptional regulator [Streptomyces rimosus subsp. rimosus]
MSDERRGPAPYGGAVNVELRHLRALAAIGDEGTITGAAAALHVSQPALSRTLEQLESRLGTSLVERTTRRLRLTPAGRRLYEHAHRILTQLDDALTEATAGPRALRVGFVWAALGRHTVPLLREWRRARPDVPVEVHRLADPEAELRRGTVDLAFLRTLPADDGALHTVALYQERRMAALCESDPLAGADAVGLADLAHHPIALCATACTTSTELWPAGRRPRHTFEVANVDEWLTAIATGEAAGVTAEATGHSHPHPGVRYLPITDAGPLTVLLARPRTATHPATAAFADHARRILRGGAAGAPVTDAATAPPADGPRTGATPPPDALVPPVSPIA